MAMEPVKEERICNRAMGLAELRSFHDFVRVLCNCHMLVDCFGNLVLWQGCNQYTICDCILKPNLIKSRNQDYSWAELMGSPRPATVFVSHCWVTPFREFMMAVESHAKKYESQWAGGAGDVGYWICVYANRQLRLDAEMEESVSLDRCPFFVAHKMAKHVLLVLDKSSSAVGRIWCIFELNETTRREERDHITFDVGSHVGLVGDEGFSSGHVVSAMQSLNVSAAQATVAFDRVLILTHIAQGWAHDFPEKHREVQAELDKHKRHLEINAQLGSQRPRTPSGSQRPAVQSGSEKSRTQLGPLWSTPLVAVQSAVKIQAVFRGRRSARRTMQLINVLRDLELPPTWTNTGELQSVFDAYLALLLRFYSSAFQALSDSLKESVERRLGGKGIQREQTLDVDAVPIPHRGVSLLQLRDLVESVRRDVRHWCRVQLKLDPASMALVEWERLEPLLIGNCKVREGSRSAKKGRQWVKAMYGIAATTPSEERKLEGTVVSWGKKTGTLNIMFYKGVFSDCDDIEFLIGDGFAQQSSGVAWKLVSQQTYTFDRITIRDFYDAVARPLQADKKCIFQTKHDTPQPPQYICIHARDSLFKDLACGVEWHAEAWKVKDTQVYFIPELAETFVYEAFEKLRGDPDSNVADFPIMNVLKEDTLRGSLVTLDSGVSAVSRALFCGVVNQAMINEEKKDCAVSFACGEGIISTKRFPDAGFEMGNFSPQIAKKMLDVKLCMLDFKLTSGRKPVEKHVWLRVIAGESAFGKYAPMDHPNYAKFEHWLGKLAAWPLLRDAVLLSKVLGTATLKGLVEEYRLDVNSEQYRGLVGESLLHIAASVRGAKDTVAYLLEQKADINSRDLDGNLPLHYAAVCGNAGVAELLMRNDHTTRDTKNKLGNTPLLVAEKELVQFADVDYFHTIAILKNPGAAAPEEQECESQDVSRVAADQPNVFAKGSSAAWKLTFYSLGEGELFTPVFEMTSEKNFATVVPGDDALFVGGGALNGAAGRILGACPLAPNRPLQDIEKYQELHESLFKKTNEQSIHRLWAASATMLLAHGHLEFSSCRLFPGRMKNFGSAFVHIFKNVCRPMNQHSVGFVYTVGPLGVNARAPGEPAIPEGRINDVMKNDRHFVEYLKQTAANCVHAVLEYNTMCRHHLDLPHIEVLRMPLISGGVFRHPLVSKKDVAIALLRGVLEALQSGKDEVGLEVNFAYDEDSFKKAAMELKVLAEGDTEVLAPGTPTVAASSCQPQAPASAPLAAKVVRHRSPPLLSEHLASAPPAAKVVRHRLASAPLAAKAKLAAASVAVPAQVLADPADVERQHVRTKLLSATGLHRVEDIPGSRPRSSGTVRAREVQKAMKK